MTSRRADTGCTKPCSQRASALQHNVCQGFVPTGAGALVAHQDVVPSLQPLYTGLFAEPLSEKSPPQSGHPSSPLLSSFCCFSLPVTHVDNTGAQLFLPSPFGNSRLPSSHIISGAGRPTKCHACRVSPRPAFDVTFSAVAAPPGLVEQPDERPAGERRGRGQPAADTLPSAAVHSGHLALPRGTPRSPKADLSLPREEPPVPLSAICWIVTAGMLYPIVPLQGGGKIVGIAMGKKQDVSVSL